MATVFKLVHRVVKLKAVLRALFGSPAYVNAAQKAIEAYNRSTKKPVNRIPKNASGLFQDAVQSQILDSRFWGLCDDFLAASRAAMYLLRLVDTCGPCLGKVYYSSALIGKQLAMLSQSGNSMAKEMGIIFKRRWARWHKPVHTLAYALDPSYQSHSLSPAEKRDIKQTFNRLMPGKAAALMIELNTFKS